MGKFGKKNTVNLNPLAYSICVLGESKIGKTTLVKEVCEKLVGEDGYMFLEVGQERGADAINGINYINCPEWNKDYDDISNSAGFIDVIDDIIENKVTDYPDLKIIVWDTYDQLINIAEAESIRLWNKECKQTGHPEKQTKSINAAWGGFGKGEKKALELMFSTKAKLRDVGVQTLVIGHCKTKDVTDVVSGETYQIVTSDQQQNYFNALKKDLHFLALAYIDRKIIKEKTGKKNIVNGKEEIVNKISEETRRIKFRDDNYAVDSGCRFADIVSEIEMSSDAFIDALTNAILSEQKKSGTSLTNAKKEQAKLEKAQEEKIKKNSEVNKENGKRDELISKITTFFIENKTSLDVIKPVMSAIRELGYKNPNEISTLDEALGIYKLINND